MSSFSVSKAARADLKDIAEYTQETWGARQRRTYLKELDKAFHYLSENPLSGVACSLIEKGLRKHSHRHHIIFYFDHNEEIFIVRILHKSMDVELQLKNS